MIIQFFFFLLNSAHVKLDVLMETALDPTIALVTLDGQVFDATKVRALELYALLFAFFFSLLGDNFSIAW